LLLRPLFGVFGQLLLVGSDAKHQAFRFRGGQLIRKSTRFFSAPAPMLGIFE
jgi:hypothetical protein